MSVPPLDAPVTREDLRRALGRLAAEAPDDPREGLFGSGTLMWDIGRESAPFLGGGRAALLQLAHPFVAQAIKDHSRTLHDVAGRFQGTFAFVFEMVFGARAEAVRAAERVHALHTRIKGRLEEDAGAWRAGQPYDANRRDALRWVLATLWDSAILVFERVVRPLRPEEKERYYAESVRGGALFGLEPAHFPPSWDGFQAYVRGMLASEELGVSAAGFDLAQHILRPPRRLMVPVAAWVRVLTAGFLPRRFREAFALSWGPLERAAFHASLAVARGIYPRLPGKLRWNGPYLGALERLRPDEPRPRFVVNDLLQAYFGHGSRAWT